MGGEELSRSVIFSTSTSKTLLTNFNELDQKRVLSSALISQSQQKRFQKRQLRSKKLRKQVAKFGRDSSGKYTAAQGPTSDSEADTAK